jgi:hypothetical protein
MRIIFSIVIVVALAASFGACKSGSGPATFCDTACMKDSLKFVNNNHPLKPYVYINAKNCSPDTITWSYEGAQANRKIGFAYLLQEGIKLDKNFTRCFLSDTTQAWLLFNDCETGRGYQVKLPFNKNKSMNANSSGLNNLDKKFAVSDELVVYSDRGNLFVEDMATGKKAMMTFGKRIEIDYDNIHATIDSINVTATNIWAKVKLDGEWKVLEKKITLQ